MPNSRVKNIITEVLSNHWYTLNKITFDYQMPNGSWVKQTRESYDRGNGAAVLLYNTQRQSVILIKQFRMPSYMNGNDTGMMTEVCAGLLDGDDPVTCVIKEAEEETGYKIEDVEKVSSAYMSPGAVTEIVHLFIAAYRDDMKVSEGGGLDEEQEDITVHEIKFDEALMMIQSGEIKDAKTIMLLQHLYISGKMNRSR